MRRLGVVVALLPLLLAAVNAQGNFNLMFLVLQKDNRIFINLWSVYPHFLTFIAPNPHSPSHYYIPRLTMVLPR